MSPPLSVRKASTAQISSSKRDNYERRLVSQGTAINDKPINRLTKTIPTYDASPEDAAIRETREEAGISTSDQRPDYTSRDGHHGGGRKRPASLIRITRDITTSPDLRAAKNPCRRWRRGDDPRTTAMGKIIRHPSNLR